jgi:hypothetical protein
LSIKVSKTMLWHQPVIVQISRIEHSKQNTYCMSRVRLHIKIKQKGIYIKLGKQRQANLYFCFGNLWLFVSL